MYKEEDMKAWTAWSRSPNPLNQKNLLARLDPLIVSEVNKITGMTPAKRAVLKTKAKVLVIKALKNYDPSKAQINTYVVTQLRKLKRFAYDYSNTARIPENRQLKIREFKEAITTFEDIHKRAPTDAELVKDLKWPTIEVTRMRKELRSEIAVSAMIYTPATIGIDSNIDRKVELVFDSLGIRDQSIFDYTIGAHGRRVYSNNEIARKLGISPALVSQRKKYIAEQLQRAGISRFATASTKKLFEGTE